VGDIFQVALGNGKSAFGQVVARGFYDYYMVAFDFASEEIPKLEVIAAKDLLFAGDFSNEFIASGRWHILGKVLPALDRIPFPKYKVWIGDRYYVVNWEGTTKRPASKEEINLLSNRLHSSASILEKALKAHFGLEDEVKAGFAPGVFERFRDPYK